MSRLDPVMKNFIGTESADDLAQEILGVLTEGSMYPKLETSTSLYINQKHQI